MTERRFWKLLLYIAVFCAAAFLLFRFLLPVLLPFGIGLALARLGEPAVDALETRGHFPRAVATGLVMGGLFLLLTLTLYLLSRTGAAELSRLAAKLPALLEGLRGPLAALRDRLLRLADRAPDGLGRALRDWTGRLFSGTSSLMERLSGGVLDLASGVVARVPGVFLFLVTTVVSSFMFSAERQKLAAWAGAHLPARWRAGTERLRGHLCQALCGWLRAELRLSLLIFGIVSAGLFVLGVDAPLVLGAVIAAVDALPVFGTGTVLIPWGLWCLLQGKTVLGAGLLVLYALAVTARTTLEPRLVGRQIGLHPLLALLSMYAGFQLFGVGGMILLPIASLLARQLWVYGGFSA